MKRQIESEIESLKNKILRMGAIAEEMIQLATKGCLERKGDLCKVVFEREEEVNRLQMEIDEESVKVLALYQPEATDLRTVLAMVKINNDLERIADQAVNIAQTSFYHLLKEDSEKPLAEIPRMAELAKEMLKESLEAFSKKDVDLARGLLRKDEEEDTLKTNALNELIAMIPQNPAHAKLLLDWFLIAKNIEKIADHATNIAEDVVFMVSGKDIRHHSN